MEIVTVLGILGLYFLAPVVLGAVALVKVRGLRRRVEDLERFAHRRELRGAVPESAPAPAAPPPFIPVEREAVVAAAQPIRPRLLQPVVVTPVRAPAPMRAERVVAWPAPAPRAPVPAAPAAKKDVSIENVIGQRVLPRIGVVAIVLGLALLVWYAWGRFGAEGKIALTASTGAVMVIGGVILGRTSATQLLGNCLIGGGWAVLYITAYASHSIPASRIIASPLLGFLVLFAVAEAALVHAMRYRSESVAGLAYLLTIATLLISPAPLEPAAGWGAVGLSGGILLALALKEKWIRLCVFGASLLYVAEAVWLSRTVHQPENILLALGVLALLWLMWTLPSYFLKPKTAWDRRFHGLLVAVNALGLLVGAALVQRWFQLQHMGWVWILLGALNALSAFIGRNAAWRPAYLTNLAVAAVFTAVGARAQFPELGPVAVWSGIAAALFAWGLGRRDAVPRFMGLAALAATFATFWRFDRGLDYAAAPALTIAALFYGASAILARRRDAHEIEKALIQPLSHAGALALGLAIWRYAPDLAAGAVFSVAGLALLMLGRRWRAAWLTAEGLILLTIPVFFVAAETLAATGDVGGISRRIASTVPVLLAWLIARHGAPKAAEFFGVLLFGGTLALVACERPAAEIPVAWALACAAWFVWSRLAAKDFEFILAGVGAAATVLVYATASDLCVPAVGWTGPVGSGSILAAIFIGIHLLSGRSATGVLGFLARDILAGAIAVTGFTLLATELTGLWRPASLAILGFALPVYGSLARDRVSRWTGLGAVGLALAHMAQAHLPQAPVFWALVCAGWFAAARCTGRQIEYILAAITAAGAVLVYCIAPHLRVPAVEWSGPVASGALLLSIFVAIHLAARNLKPAVARDGFAVALAVTAFALLAREMTGTWLTGSWAVLGFALAAYGFVVRDRISRWSSLLVLGVCLGKVAIFDFATFDMPVKIATLITLGTVMVALSFIYARHHRRILGYLTVKGEEV